MKELFTKDLDKLEKLISLGYKNSLKSLSLIVQEVAEINIKPLEIWDVRKDRNRTFYKSYSEEIIILTTEIIGEMKGKSYFLLDKEEVVALTNHCKTPESMTDAFLLEIDNMLAAAVITIFSNHCHLKMYGGVPNITKVNEQDFSDFVLQDLETLENFNGVCLVAETHFVFDGNLEITPQFLWFLPEEFVMAVSEKVTLEV